MWQVLQAAAVDAPDGTITLGTLPKTFSTQVAESAARAFAGLEISLEGLRFPFQYDEIEDEFFAHVVDAYFKMGRPGCANVALMARDWGVGVPIMTSRLRRLDALGRLAARGSKLLDSYEEI
jgi:hypothetical protein